MPSFIVYLPPTLVDLKDVSAAHVPISFRTIPRPASLESQSLSLGRDSLLGRLLVDQDPTVDRNGKRKATTDDLDDSVPSVIFTDETDLRVPSAPDIVEDLSESVNQDFIWETTRHGIGIEDEGKDVVVSHHVETGTKAFLRPSSPTQEARPDPAPPRRAGPSSRIQHTGPRIGLHGDASRRQSKRLKATDLMAALPALQADDSIVSLNTTISNPSQLPPSGQEGDTSMYNLPRFTIPLSKLSPLDTLLSNNKSRRDSQSLDAKVHVIVCITSTTAPVVRKRKEERVRGMDGTLWIAKWDVVAPSSSTGGREAGCEVVLWDKCARDYGEYVRRGDVVLLENVEFRPASKRDKAQLILSTSFPNPRPIILYRTLPRYASKSDYIRSSPRNKGQEQQGKIIPEDKALRPDLRIARSDPGIRRVADIVRWFAQWVGGEGP